MKGNQNIKFGNWNISRLRKKKFWVKYVNVKEIKTFNSYQTSVGCLKQTWLRSLRATSQISKWSLTISWKPKTRFPFKARRWKTCQKSKNKSEETNKTETLALSKMEFLI